MPAHTPAPREQPTPIFRELSDAEMDEVLARNHVGRIAYTFHDRVDIVPVAYVYRDGWLYGRTSPSDKLVTLRHHHWIAFEVDEVEGPFGWRSVVVHSAFYPLTAEDPEWRRAVDILRSLMPHAFRAHDPVPHRTIIFRIPVEERTGRAAEGGPPPAH